MARADARAAKLESRSSRAKINCILTEARFREVVS